MFSFDLDQKLDPKNEPVTAAVAADRGSDVGNPLDDEGDIGFRRMESRQRLKATWDAIFEKYSTENIDSDIIDITTGKIVQDNGVIRNTPAKPFGKTVKMIDVECSPSGVWTPKKVQKCDQDILVEEEETNNSRGDNPTKEEEEAQPPLPLFLFDLAELETNKLIDDFILSPSLDTRGPILCVTPQRKSGSVPTANNISATPTPSGNNGKRTRKKRPLGNNNTPTVTYDDYMDEVLSSDDEDVNQQGISTANPDSSLFLVDKNSPYKLSVIKTTTKTTTTKTTTTTTTTKDPTTTKKNNDRASKKKQSAVDPNVTPPSAFKAPFCHVSKNKTNSPLNRAVRDRNFVTNAVASSSTNATTPTNQEQEKRAIYCFPKLNSYNDDNESNNNNNNNNNNTNNSNTSMSPSFSTRLNLVEDPIMTSDNDWLFEEFDSIEDHDPLTPLIR